MQWLFVQLKYLSFFFYLLDNFIVLFKEPSYLAFFGP